MKLNKDIFFNLNNNFKNFINKNPFLIGIFAISLFYFLIQHYFDLSWDFKAYVLNAKYLFSNGSIFEVYRAPMASLILGLFSWLGKLSEYFYIILGSVLFLYSSIKIADALYEKYFFKFKINKEFARLVFYGLSINIFTLHYGFLVGTELLGLAFFELFLAYFILNKKSGHFLGLACLTRYNFLMFFPFLFINKDYKKIIKNLLLFFLILIPWYLFNLIKWGNGFTSIASSYNLNIISRLDVVQEFSFSSILIVMNWLLPLFLIGLIITFYYFKKNKQGIKYSLLFIAIFALIIFDFYETPFKINRYLFNLILPIVFFSSISIFYLSFKLKKHKNKTQKIISVLLIGIVLLFFVNLVFNPFGQSMINKHESENVYKNIANDISESRLSECHFFSSHWVLVNYYYPCSSFMMWNISKSFSNNYPLILFYNLETIDDKYNKSEIDNYDYISKNNDYAILAPNNMTNNTCVKWKGYDYPGVENSCEVLSQRFSFLKLDSFLLKICNKVNLD